VKRAGSRERRAESREQRAESGEQRAESGEGSELRKKKYRYKNGCPEFDDNWKTYIYSDSCLEVWRI
jgi:hypothetical protein